MSGFYFGEMQTRKAEHSSNTGKAFKHEEWQKAIDKYPQQGSIQKSTACYDTELCAPRQQPMATCGYLNLV